MIDELREALIDCVNQACQVRVDGDKTIVDHEYLGTYESALDLLERMGYAKHIGGREYELYWVKQ